MTFLTTETSKGTITYKKKNKIEYDPESIYIPGSPNTISSETGNQLTVYSSIQQNQLQYIEKQINFPIEDLQDAAETHLRMTDGACWNQYIDLLKSLTTQEAQQRLKNIYYKIPIYTTGNDVELINTTNTVEDGYNIQRKTYKIHLIQYDPTEGMKVINPTTSSTTINGNITLNKMTQSEAQSIIDVIIKNNINNTTRLALYIEPTNINNEGKITYIDTSITNVTQAIPKKTLNYIYTTITSWDDTQNMISITDQAYTIIKNTTNQTIQLPACNLILFIQDVNAYYDPSRFLKIVTRMKNEITTENITIDTNTVYVLYTTITSNTEHFYIKMYENLTDATQPTRIDHVQYYNTKTINWYSDIAYSLTDYTSLLNEIEQEYQNRNNSI